MPGRLQNYWNRRKSSFSSSGRPKRTPLPKNVVIACLCGLFPSAFLITMLFPFLPWMVKQFTVNGEKITELNSGPYVGLIASSLFFGRFAGSYFWGWFSDVKGRRPAMLYSVALLAVATTMFGFTNSALGLGWAVFTRFLTGLFNGIVGTSKAVLSEVCDNSNQAQALTLLTASFNLGLIVGPAVGGFLAEPARQYPSTFGGSSFLKLFPYVLPSMVSLALCIFGFVVMFKFLPETLASKRKYKKVGGGADSGEISSIGNGDVNSRNGRPESRGSWMVAFSAASKKTSIHSGPDILNNADDVSLDDSLSIHINHGATERYDEDDEELVEENCDPFVNASSFAAPLLSNGVSSSNNNAVPSLLQNGVKETVTAVHGPAGSDAEILSQSNNGEGDSDADDDIDDSLVMPPPGYSSCACWRWLLRYRLVRLLDRSKFMKILRRPTTRYVILLYSFYSVGVIGMDEIFSLWCSEPPHLGGLGLELNTIGTVLAIVGVAQLPLQTFVVPIFERRLGARKCFGVMSIPLIISTAIMPSLTSMASSSAVIPTLVIVQLVHKFSNGGSFVCLMLMINNSVETHDLGAANGLAMSMTGCFRANICPAPNDYEDRWLPRHVLRMRWRVHVNRCDQVTDDMFNHPVFWLLLAISAFGLSMALYFFLPQMNAALTLLSSIFLLLIISGVAAFRGRWIKHLCPARQDPVEPQIPAMPAIPLPPSPPQPPPPPPPPIPPPTASTASSPEEPACRPTHLELNGVLSTAPPPSYASVCVILPGHQHSEGTGTPPPAYTSDMLHRSRTCHNLSVPQSHAVQVASYIIVSPNDNEERTMMISSSIHLRLSQAPTLCTATLRLCPPQLHTQGWLSPAESDVDVEAGSHEVHVLHHPTPIISPVSDSLAPLACGSIFAWSIDGEHVFPFDYHLVFFLLSFLFLCTSIASTRVSDLVDKKLGTHADDVDVRQEENNAPGVAVAADAEQANQIEDVLEEAV